MQTFSETQAWSQKPGWRLASPWPVNGLRRCLLTTSAERLLLWRYCSSRIIFPGVANFFWQWCHIQTMPFYYIYHSTYAVHQAFIWLCLSSMKPQSRLTPPPPKKALKIQAGVQPAARPRPNTQAVFSYGLGKAQPPLCCLWHLWYSCCLHFAGCLCGFPTLCSLPHIHSITYGKDKVFLTGFFFSFFFFRLPFLLSQALQISGTETPTKE